MIHRVELPACWEVTGRVVTADSESTNVRPVGRVDDTTVGCLVAVYGPTRGDPSTNYPRRAAVDVNGHAGFSSPASDVQSLSQVLTAVDLGPGIIRAGPGHAAARHLQGIEPAVLGGGRRVRFEAVETRLPFRVRSLPDGYQVLAVYPTGPR